MLIQVYTYYLLIPETWFERNENVMKALYLYFPSLFVSQAAEGFELQPPQWYWLVVNRVMMNKSSKLIV